MVRGFPAPSLHVCHQRVERHGARHLPYAAQVAAELVWRLVRVGVGVGVRIRVRGRVRVRVRVRRRLSGAWLRLGADKLNLP